MIDRLADWPDPGTFVVVKTRSGVCIGQIVSTKMHGHLVDIGGQLEFHARPCVRVMATPGSPSPWE